LRWLPAVEKNDDRRQKGEQYQKTPDHSD